MRQWPHGTHTKRLSADGILSALANRISLTLPWIGTTPFTRPTSEGPDLKTSPLGNELYTQCELRTVPANSAIELSLGDTDNKRLCPASTNSSPSPRRINGGRRSNCTAISAAEKKKWGFKMSTNPRESRSLWDGDELSRSRHEERLNVPRGIELPRVISADHFQFGVWSDVHPVPYLEQQLSSGKSFFWKIHI